jgi:hypothetical protein
MSDSSTADTAEIPDATPKRRRCRIVRSLTDVAPDMRTRAGRLLKTVRAELTAHVGGNPTATQQRLIERAAILTAHLARMDTAILNGSASPDASYVSMSSSLARITATLGLDVAEVPAPTLSDILRMPPASKAPEPVQAVAGATAPAAADKPLAGFHDGHRDVA